MLPSPGAGAVRRFGDGHRASFALVEQLLERERQVVELAALRGLEVYPRIVTGTFAAVILRCTARLIDLIGRRGVMLVDAPATDEDWYANLRWIDRRKCLLLTHAGTLFSIFAAHVRKPDVREPGPFVTGLVAAALASERLPTHALGMLDPADVHIARTASRSVLGHMNDMALMCEHEVEIAGGLALTDVAGVNHRLRRGLHNRGGYVVPLDLAVQRADAGSSDAQALN